jgi:hypothetical protein
MDELIKQLAQERMKAFDAKVIINRLIESIKASDEYQQAELAYKNAQVEIGNLEIGIKAQALDRYSLDGNKHPSSAVEIKEFEVVRCDMPESEIRGWCLVNLPGVLKVDGRAFDKAAKAGVVEIAKVEIEPRAQIKQDLSDWL